MPGHPIRFVGGSRSLASYRFVTDGCAQGTERLSSSALDSRPGSDRVTGNCANAKVLVSHLRFLSRTEARNHVICLVNQPGRRAGWRRSRRTVETHRANAMRLLGIKKQTELVRYALTRLP